MSLVYVIDGYNLLNHPGLSREHKRVEGPAKKILKLINEKKLTGSPKNKILLVFDGYPAGESPQYNNSEVIFSRKVSADEKIKNIVEESADRKNIIVVSDDREIKFAVKSLGCLWMGISDFLGAREKKEAQQEKDDDLSKQGFSYSSMHKINQELRKLWLKEK